MHNTQRNIALLVLLVLFYIPSTFALAAQEKVWRIASSKEIVNGGASIKNLRGIVEARGIKLIVDYFPWKRAKSVALKPGYLGFYPAWKIEVTDKFVESDIIDWSYISVMKNSDKEVKFESIDQLFKNHRVGLVGTYEYPQDITDAMLKYPHNVDKAINEITLLKKLAKGRTNIALTDPVIMLHLAEQEGISNIKEVKKVVKTALVIALTNSVENQKRIKQLHAMLKQSK